MEISEVRIKLVSGSAERLRAFCSVTLDGDFVIRDLKIIEGVNGAFVAMPSRKLADRCSRCGCKNHLRAKYCNECGQKLRENRAPKDGQGRAKLHADIAHPINTQCRERIQQAVIEAYQAELRRAEEPGYKPASFDDFEDDVDDDYEAADPAPPPGGKKKEAPAREAKSDGGFSDYNSLIAELKRDAADRRRQGEGRHDAVRREEARREEAQREEVHRDEVQRDEARRSEQPRENQRRSAGRRDGQPHREDRGGGRRGGEEQGTRPAWPSDDEDAPAETVTVEEEPTMSPADESTVEPGQEGFPADSASDAAQEPDSGGGHAPQQEPSTPPPSPPASEDNDDFGAGLF